MKTVSVIVPVFEVEDYIEGCLTSIVNQTYPHLQIICINDCTGDNSATVVKRFMRDDPRITLLHHDRNRGLGAARNTALQHVSGEYVKFVDSDDALTPDAIETLMLTISRTAAHWVMAAFHVIDERGGLTSRSPFHVADLEQRANTGLIDVSSDPNALNGVWPSAWNGLWRTDRILAAKARFSEGLHFEDHEFFFTYGFGSQSFAYVPEPLYMYRGSRPGQITRDTSTKIFDVLTVLERLFRIFGKNLKGDALLRFSARTAVRLIVERTWALPSEGQIVESYTREAARFLAQFDHDLLFECKDWYIAGETLEALMLPRVDAEQHLTTKVHSA